MAAAARRDARPCGWQLAAKLGFDIVDDPIGLEHLAGLFVNASIDIDHKRAYRRSRRHTNHRRWEMLPPSPDGGLIGGGMVEAATAALSLRRPGPLGGRVAGKDAPAMPRVIQRKFDHGIAPLANSAGFDSRRKAAAVRSCLPIAEDAALKPSKRPLGNRMANRACRRQPDCPCPRPGF
jgi:hypothetical protein